MRVTTTRVWLAAFAVLLLAGARLVAHHEILAKFDNHKPVTLNGIVTLVDWRNPHVHVFMNVAEAAGPINWAIELEGPIDLEHSGWSRETLRPGDRIRLVAQPLGGVPERQPPGVGQFRHRAGDRQERLQRHADAARAAARTAADAAVARPAASPWRSAGRLDGVLGVSERHGARGR